MPFGWGANPNRMASLLERATESKVTNAFRLGG